MPRKPHWTVARAPTGHGYNLILTPFDKPGGQKTLPLEATRYDEAVKEARGIVEAMDGA